jgi:hypothetical protein
LILKDKGRRDYTLTPAILGPTYGVHFKEHAQIEAARQKFATGCPLLLSELWRLNSQEFRFFLDLLGEAIATKAAGDDGVTEIQSNDGLYLIRLEPLDANTEAEIVTDDGLFAAATTALPSPRRTPHEYRLVHAE